MRLSTRTFERELCLRSHAGNTRVACTHVPSVGDAMALSVPALKLQQVLPAVVASPPATNLTAGACQAGLRRRAIMIRP